MQVDCGHLVGTVPGRDNTFDEHGRDTHWRVSQAGDRLGWNQPTGSHFPLPSGGVHELSSDYAAQAGLELKIPPTQPLLCWDLQVGATMPGFFLLSLSFLFS